MSQTGSQLMQHYSAPAYSEGGAASDSGVSSGGVRSSMRAAKGGVSSRYASAGAFGAQPAKSAGAFGARSFSPGRTAFAPPTAAGAAKVHLRMPGNVDGM